MPKIAVASQNFRTVTGHAGKTRRFLIYQVEPGEEPQEVERMDLPKEMAFHEFHDSGAHPLDGVQTLIVGSCGAGFVRRLADRGVAVVVTAETDPARAIRDYLAGTLKPPAPSTDSRHRGGTGHS